MSGEARKLHLIEEILKTEDSSILDEVESAFTKARAATFSSRRDFTEFVGLITENEAKELKDIINQGCEQINPDDWK